MNRETYSLLETYMLSCMDDAAHDAEHVYRVLYQALELAAEQPDADRDVLIAACLLHDIGRKEQFANSTVCHARAGGEKAYQFLLSHGFSEGYARRVRHCVQTHRYRNNDPPESIEAKILFDADKLDVTGAIGIARTLLYKGIVSEPLYTLRPDGSVSDGEPDTVPSFLEEYRHKLEKVYSRFYTEKAKGIARERQAAASAFYGSLYREASAVYGAGRAELAQMLAKDGC